MAVTAGTTKLNAHAVRADFPIFEQKIHGKPLAFLDSAASSQKPRQMLEAEIVSRVGPSARITLQSRIDTVDELDYFRNGGILHYVLRNLGKAA